MGDLDKLEWKSDIEKILDNYNQEALVFIKDLFQNLVNDSDDNDFDIISIIQREQDFKKEKTEKDDNEISFISYLENFKIKEDINRPKIYFKSAKDYSFKSGWLISYTVPDIKLRDIVISDYLYKQVEIQILYHLESWNKNEYSKINLSQLDQTERDEMMFSADDFDLSAMNQNKETIKEITNRKKIKQEYYQTQQQNNLKRTHKAWSIKLKNLINQGHPFSIKPRIIQDFWFNEVKKSEVDINKHIHRTKRLSILEVKDYFESEDIID